MLTEYQLELLPERICERLNRINTEYLQKIGHVVRELGEARPSDVHKLQRMYKNGADVNDIIRKLSQESERNIEEIYEIFDIVAKENYDYSESFFAAKGLPYLPYEKNKELQQYVKSLAKQTVGEYVNLTQHTAFTVFSNGGKSIAPLFDNNKDKVATSLSDTYTKVIDYAVTKVQTGVTDYQSAMREVMKAMADSGIRTVDYATGYSRRLESAVRQNILWGVKQCNQNTADMIGEQFGADGYEISYHSNPRPSHADMGGKQYAIGPARMVNGKRYPSFEKEAESLLSDYGCLHFKFSILLGVSRPAYSEEQLAQFKEEDNRKFEFEGKEYTKYEASQLQKRIESEVRRQKDRATIAKAAGDDVMRREAQYKINLLTNKYARLSKESGLPTKMERLKSATKPLTNGNSSGIMKVSGAVSGARNPYGEKAKAHAEKYYGLVRAMKTDVVKIAKTTGFSEQQIQNVKNFIFYEKHDLGGNEPEFFKPDFMMAESWKRLVDGKPEPHDITLIRHELMERDLIKQGYSQDQAHILTTKKYNYDKEATEFYDKIEKYKN